MANFEIPQEKLDKSPQLRAALEAEEKEAAEREKADADASKKKAQKTQKITPAEAQEIHLLLNEPFVFHCPTIYRRFLGIKSRPWKIHYQSFDTLVRLGREYAELHFDSDQVDQLGVEYMKYLTAEQGERFGKIVAIAVTGFMPFAGLIRPFLAKYFSKRLNPSMMVKIAHNLNTHAEYQDFFISIGLTRGRRLTQPAPIEENKEG